MQVKMPPKELNGPEDLWTAPFDPRFPNQNQTRYGSSICLICLK